MPASDSNRTIRFGKNVFWNLSGQGTLLALGFFLVPLLLRSLGSEGYALYGLLGMVAGYLSLLSFGSPSATQRTVAEHVARREMDQLWPILYFSIFLHTAGVLLGATTVLLLRARLTHRFFDISPELRQPGAWIIACGATAAVFFSWTQFALAVLQGLQKFGLANLLTILQSGLVLIGSVALLSRGFGLQAVAVFFVSVQLAISIIAFITALRLMPPPSRTSGSAVLRSKKLREFSSYAFSVFLAQLAWSVTFQWDKAIIGYFFPMTQLTYYLIPSFLLRRFWVLANSVTTTAFPLMSELSGLGDHATLRKAYRQCSQLTLWLIIPGFALLFVLAPRFLTLWLGPEFASQAARPLRLLSTAYFLHQLGNMPLTAAYGLGKPSSALAWQMLQATVSLGCWYILIPRLGITGAALGLLAAQALTAPPYALMVSRSLFSMGPAQYLEGILLRPLAAGAVLILFLWPLQDQAGTWTSLLGLTAASATLYYAAGFALLSAEDRLTLEKLWTALSLRRLQTQ
ncbi:MAG: oligosaccharide flippase family protein [Elusimicrobiota bacterium]